jgi:hypothetical protein
MNTPGTWWTDLFLCKYLSYIVVVSFLVGGNLSTRRKPPASLKSLTNLKLYRVHIVSVWFELTMLVVIGTDWIGNCTLPMCVFLSVIIMYLYICNMIYEHSWYLVNWFIPVYSWLWHLPVLDYRVHTLQSVSQKILQTLEGDNSSRKYTSHPLVVSPSLIPPLLTEQTSSLHSDVINSKTTVGKNMIQYSF